MGHLFKIIVLSMLLLMTCKDGNSRTLPINDPPVFSQLQAILPPHWQLCLENDQVILERKGDVWILFDNQINAPLTNESAEDKAKRIQHFGQKGKSQFVFRYETKWSVEKIQQVKQTNGLIYQRIAKLPEKYNIIHLYSKNLSRKGEETYLATNEEEEKRIKAYQEEKERLQKQVIRLPDYTIEHHSLFLVSKTGMADEYYVVYPEVASQEMVTILNALQPFKKD